MTKTLVVLATVALAGCRSTPVAKTPESTVQTTHSSDETLITRVEPSLVCMVNNRFMGKPQIPVLVGGKTYFGCCEMCKGRLETDRNARVATDPITGANVDKADSVIGKDEAGAVLYFENEANLKRYQTRGG